MVHFSVFMVELRGQMALLLHIQLIVFGFGWCSARLTIVLHALIDLALKDLSEFHCISCD